MPESALPEWIKDQAIGTKTDWDNPIQKYWRKSWFAYGPRAKEFWAKWREWPKTLFAIRSKQGIWRVESEGWERDSAWESDYDYGQRAIIWEDLWATRDLSNSIIEHNRGYLSRVQYYSRWSFQIQWPFLITVHFYPKVSDVPVWGQPRPETDGKVWFFYIGAHRDSDKVYWFPSAYVGRNWK